MNQPQINRVELHAFGQQLNLTQDEVIAEVKSGRLGFDVDDDGCVFTDTFSVMDWSQRRIAALATFGAEGVEFPMYKCDWQSLEHLPSPRTISVTKPQQQKAGE